MVARRGEVDRADWARLRQQFPASRRMQLIQLSRRASLHTLVCCTHCRYSNGVQVKRGPGPLHAALGPARRHRLPFGFPQAPPLRATSPPEAMASEWARMPAHEQASQGPKSGRCLAHLCCGALPLARSLRPFPRSPAIQLLLFAPVVLPPVKVHPSNPPSAHPACCVHAPPCNPPHLAPCNP